MAQLIAILFIVILGGLAVGIFVGIVITPIVFVIAFLKMRKDKRDLDNEK